VVVGVKAGSELIGIMREMGLDVRPLPIAGKLNPAAPFRVAALARETGAQVIHSHLSSAALHGTLAGRLTGLPSIAHVRALNRAFWYRGATRAIAVSQAVKDHLVAQGMAAERIDVVYNGVDPDRYYLPCTREEAKRRLGVPESAPVIGIVGHLSSRKGHAVFLEAFARVAPRSPEAVAVLLGEGERAALEAQAAALGLKGRVLFCGFQKDVLPYYAAFDLVALPSVEGEGLPRALLEAGLLGRASLGTRLSGVPEIIREGETGFIVPVRDVAALAERLEALLADSSLRERMGASAREWIASTFTLEAMVTGVLHSYGRAGAR
jgi:glycosyltransferase involved in cell wall biosynthesis